MNIGPMEIALIFGAALLLIGPNKLPELARSLGNAMREYRRALNGATSPSSSISQQLSQGMTSSNPLSEEEQLINEAKRLGIPTEGRSIDEIAQDILNYSEEADSDTANSST